MTSDAIPLAYFGKIPSRGDFVRSKSQSAKIDSLDGWVSDALGSNKSLFKHIGDIAFSHVDTNNNQILTGTLIASHDSNERLYPLIGFSLQHNEKPKNWLKYAPIKSYGIWEQAFKTLQNARRQTSDITASEILNSCLLTIDENASTYYYDFISHTTLADLALHTRLDKENVIKQIIATGLLFIPTYSKGFHGLNKALCWSLGTNKEVAIKLATYWHDLIHGFYQPHSIYMNTYFYKIDEYYQMALSFSKPNSQLLIEIVNEGMRLPDSWVSFDDCQWTQSYIDDDIGLSRFYDLLTQDQMYLYDIRQLFKQIFLAQ